MNILSSLLVRCIHHSSRSYIILLFLYMKYSLCKHSSDMHRNLVFSWLVLGGRRHVQSFILWLVIDFHSYFLGVCVVEISFLFSLPDVRCFFFQFSCNQLTLLKRKKKNSVQRRKHRVLIQIAQATFSIWIEPKRIFCLHNFLINNRFVMTTTTFRLTQKVNPLCHRRTKMCMIRLCSTLFLCRNIHPVTRCSVHHQEVVV